MSKSALLARIATACASIVALHGCQVFGEPPPPLAGTPTAAGMPDAGAPPAPIEVPEAASDQAAIAGASVGTAAAPDSAAGAGRDHAEAVAFLPSLLRPRDPALFAERDFTAALAALRGERPREATILFERLRQDAPDHAGLRRLHLWSLLEMGESGPALPLARDAAGGTGADPRMAAPADALLMGRAVAMEAGEAESAPWYARATDAAEADADTLMAAASASLAAGQGAFAARCMDRYVLQRPLDDQSTLLRARCLLAAGQHEGALALYDRLLADPAVGPELWDEAGLAAFQAALASRDAGLFVRATSLFEEALALNPQDGRVQFNLGCALDWGGKAELAEAAYGRAIELRPGYMNAVENLVQLLRRQGRRDEARRVLVEQLRQPLTAEELERTRANLDALESDEPPVSAGPPLGEGASPGD